MQENQRGFFQIVVLLLLLAGAGAVTYLLQQTSSLSSQSYLPQSTHLSWPTFSLPSSNLPTPNVTCSPGGRCPPASVSPTRFPGTSPTPYPSTVSTHPTPTLTPTSTPTPTLTPTLTPTPTPTSTLPLGIYTANSTNGNSVSSVWTTKSRDQDWVFVFGSGATQINYLEGFSGKAGKALVYSAADTATAGQIMDQINSTSGNSIHSVMANIESSNDPAVLQPAAQAQYNLAKSKGFTHFIFAPLGPILSANYQTLADGSTGDLVLYQTQKLQLQSASYTSTVRQTVANIKSLANHPQVLVQLAVSVRNSSTTFQCFSASEVEGFINDLRNGPANTVPDGFVIFYFLSDPNAGNADAQCTSISLPTQPEAVKSLLQNYFP